MSEQLDNHDLLLWLEQTIEQLKNRDFESWDIEHLIEELVAVGKSAQNTLTSNLMILLAHLLKLKVPMHHLA